MVAVTRVHGCHAGEEVGDDACCRRNKGMGRHMLEGAAVGANAAASGTPDTMCRLAPGLGLRRPSGRENVGVERRGGSGGV